MLKVSEVSFGPESKVRFHDDGTVGIVVEREKAQDLEAIRAEVNRLQDLAESLQTTKGNLPPLSQDQFDSQVKTKPEKPGDREAGKALMKAIEKMGFTALQGLVKRIRAGEITKEKWVSVATKSKVKRNDALVVWKFAQKEE